MGKSKRKTPTKSGLKPGIVTKLGTTEFPGSVSYIEEVKAVMAGESPKFAFPFLNQDASYKKMVSHLARSAYPYVVLVGDVGIGKTMMVDHTLAIVDGKISLEELAKQSPELESEFEQIKKKAERFQHRDYLIVPNLKKPREPIVLDYTGDTIERDLAIFDEFCADIVDVLGNFAKDNKSRIRFRFRKERFADYICAEINQFYTDIYTKIEKTTSKKSDKNKDVGLITISPRERKAGRKSTKKEEIFHFDSHFEFLNDGVKISKYKKGDVSGYSGAGGNKKEIEKGIAKNLVRRLAKKELTQLMERLKNFDIYAQETDKDPLPWEEVKAQVYEEFQIYNEEVLKPYKARFKAELFSQQVMTSELRQRPKFRMRKRISPVTLSDLESRLQTIRDKFDKTVCSSELLTWMDSVMNYFNEERVEVERTIVEMLDEVESKERNIERRQRIMTKGRGAKKLSKELLEEQEDEDDDDDRNKVLFRLRHGDYRIPVDNIFTANHFRDLAAQGTVDNVIISDFDSSSLFGTFNYHTEKTPPHSTLTSLGTYFQGGILVFPDHFSRFVKTLRGAGGDAGGSGKNTSVSGMRERFLESLQKGQMLLVNHGIIFKLNAPRMILGCDNEDPFLVQLGQGHYEYDYALKDRIEMINVPSIIENTKDTRAGTIKVILDRISLYNSTERKGQTPLIMTPEVVDLLLRENTWGESLGLLGYRGLTRDVEEIMRFAARKSHDEITLETMRELNRENSPNEVFAFVDNDFKDPDGFSALPASKIGYVNALSVYGGLMSNRIPCSSYIIRSREPLGKNKGRFELLEKQEEMTDQTANKGYALATSFLNNLFYNLRRPGLNSKEGWQILTEKVGEKYGFGGDSSALAMTISILSTLSRTPIYTNRFFTGTLQPNSGILEQEGRQQEEKSKEGITQGERTQGEAGQIGGVYTKSLTPTRLHQLLEKNGKSRDIYFMFPAGNIRELREEVMTDPFGVENHVTCIPIQNVEQAFYLATCGEQITLADIKDIDKKSKAYFAEKLKNIKATFETLDSPVDDKDVFDN